MLFELHNTDCHLNIFMKFFLFFSFDVNPSDGDDFGVSNDRLPVGTIPIIATSSPGNKKYLTSCCISDKA
jgi:hypothetical protein